MTIRLIDGDSAPPFTLPDADGKNVSLTDFPGQRVIVYFYPAAMTPGCTTQAVDFTAAMEELGAAGLHVIGISPDAQEKLIKFREKNLSVSRSYLIQTSRRSMPMARTERSCSTAS